MTLTRGRPHWIEYSLEAWALGLFMISACVFGVLLSHPASPLVRALPDPLLRRLLMGIAMGLTAVGNFYSPWGRRSGAQMNPAITLTFFRLGRMAKLDALGYVAAQFLGGLLGTLLAGMVLHRWLSDPSVAFVATLPGQWGAGWAFVAEVAISFGLMLTVLTMAGRERWAGLTGIAAGLLVAVYITLESPISGMSMNPARTLGSALPAMRWDALWIYFTAPPLGMLLAVEIRHLVGLTHEKHCAKIHHDPRYRCIFCEYSRRLGTHPPSRVPHGSPSPV